MFREWCNVVTFVDQDRPVCWRIVVKQKPTVGSQFFVSFPSDRIFKKTKDVNGQRFPSYRNSCKLSWRIRGTFWISFVLRLTFVLCLKEGWTILIWLKHVQRDMMITHTHDSYCAFNCVLRTEQIMNVVVGQRAITRRWGFQLRPVLQHGICDGQNGSGNGLYLLVCRCSRVGIIRMALLAVDFV